MKHLVGWLVTFLVIGAVSILLFELMTRGGGYGALVPWALVASIGLIFYVAAVQSDSEKQEEELRELFMRIHEIRARGRAVTLATGDIVRFTSGISSPPGAARMFGAGDRIENGSAVVNYLRTIPVGGR